MISQEFQKLNLPDSPGVYFFIGPKSQILYVGKATSLKDRVKSYFAPDLVSTRGERFVEMVSISKTIHHITTDSVLEALMVEAHEIQKRQPPYNTIGKDDKSFNYVVITDEDYPAIKVVRGREISYGSDPNLNARFVAGPFPHGGELREALKIMRRIFPYRDEKCTPAEEQRDPEYPRACWNYQIGLCPGTCVGKIDKKEYKKTIKRIELFFEGKKDKLLKSVEHDMHESARKKEFEEAGKLKRTLYALEHIHDIALIKRDLERTHSSEIFRIEAYDIAHLSGKETVGVMTVVEEGEKNPSQYRKFRIRGVRGKVNVDDTNNLKEVLRRRFTHPDWQMPNLIVVDGGVAQKNAAEEILREYQIDIPVVSVVKDKTHKAREISGNQEIIEAWKRSILLSNVEAHRFAITYHRKLRSKGFRI